MIRGYEFAQYDVNRAVTHNKGVMNAVIAIANATGQDGRALEAAAGAYACRNGRYEPLTVWSKDAKGNLKGTIEFHYQHARRRIYLTCYLYSSLPIFDSVRHCLFAINIFKADFLRSLMLILDFLPAKIWISLYATDHISLEFILAPLAAAMTDGSSMT